MSKPYIHAKSSAKRFGGVPEDYLDIHEMFDNSKSAVADVRHRVIFHSAYGIFIIEKIFGSTRVNSAGKTYSVRDIGEQHVMEDLGTIPTLEYWIKDMPIDPWMMGKKEVKNTVTIPFNVPSGGPIETPPTGGTAARKVFRGENRPLISPGVSPVEYDGSTVTPTQLPTPEVKPFTYTGPDRSRIKFID